MANVLLQAPVPVQLVLGPVTGQRYAPNGKYQFSVDPSDAVPLQATVPATGTWTWGCAIDWDEVAGTEI